MKDIGIKIAIKTVMDVLMTIGVYPQSTSTWDEKTNTIKDTKVRTEWQEGWNAAQCEIFTEINEALGKLEQEGISDELALLMMADVGYIQDGKFLLNMNDTFYYACSDCEEVPTEEIKNVAGLFAQHGYKGLTYWVSKKRNEMPQIPKYREEVEEVVNEKSKRNS